MSDNNSIFGKIEAYGVVPVVVIDKIEHVLPMADALIEGGLPVAEITFRTAAAPEAISLLNNERPQLLVGAGTVLNAESLRSAKECGARFCVAPGFNPKIVESAVSLEMPFVPGTATPSEIECAFSLGCRVLKFFPAEQSGGVSMIRALSGPYSHTGVRFIPTGGINMDNLQAYLGVTSVLAVGGTWLVTRADLANGDWQGIVHKCKLATEVVSNAIGSVDNSV